jgi:putative membrane protein
LPDDPRDRLAYDRTLLANERTYAAWLRTGLGIAAFGLALSHFPVRPGFVERAAAGTLVALGAGVVLYGGWRYVRVGSELRADASPGAHPSVVPVVILSIVVSVILGTLFFAL